MIGEMEVHLRNVKFYSFHGLAAGEEIVGGEFEVSLTAYYISSDAPVENLDQILDYTAVYDVVKIMMQQPTKLLETLAMKIASEIIAKFLIVSSVAVSVYKLHPPIAGFQGSVGVSFKLKRD